MTTRKHIRLSALSFVLVLCGSLLVSLWQPFLPGLTDTVHAELSPADVAECYAKLNGKTTGEVGVDLKSLYDAKCSKDARGGTCTISEATTYGQFGTSITIQYYSCTESQATDKIPAIKEALRGVYANAVSKKLCDGLPRDEKTNCSNSVKTATVACLNTFFDNGYEKSNITFPNIDEGTIATCVAGKTGRKADDIKQALLGAKSDADAETKKVNDDAEAARKQACEASGKYWQPGEIGGTGSCSDKAPPACQGGSLGWLICPLTEMFSSIISAIAKYLDGLLFFKPLIIGDTASGDAIYSLWRVVIVPANLLLVVAFLVVIFSQATSFGLSSYGIKKMLPRIIAAAILINLSYFLCAVAVDITNVIGAGVKGMMENVPLPNGTSLRGSTWVDWFVTGVVAHLTAGVAIVTGSVYYIVPMLAAAVIAVLTAFLVVAARQVLITLMIIIAPLAFAALVLPNTNELFTKWRKAFAALLFMYPLIMFVFYGSMVVSKIVALTTPQANDPAVNLIQQILVLCILIFPLFSLPIIMKAAGGLLQRFGLWANDKSKGLIDRSNKWAKGRQARSTFSQMMNARKDAGDANASQRAARRMGTGFGQFASTVGMNKNTKGIMQAQIGDANDKLHAQQVTYEKRNVRSRYNASDRRAREQMAKDAADAAQRGDSVAYDAIMSHAADAGADEFSHTFTQTQKELHRRDPDSLKAGTKAHKTLSDGHKFIAATHGDKLSEKNRALGEVLRQADPTANIKAAMHNDAGARAYYGKAKPEAAANFSSDTARAAAEFLDDHVLEQLLTNSELMKTVSPSARDAYQAEYAGRKSGAFSRTGEGDVSRAASAVGSDANYFDY